MIEKKIHIEDIDLRDFAGVADANLQLVASLCPTVGIVVRGDTIKVKGNQEDVDDFERRVRALTAYVAKYGHLSKEVIRQTFHSVAAEAPTSDAEHGDVILYGNGGGAIRARTPNQKKLVDASHLNDLLFAVGPAGSGKTYTAIALAVRALNEKEVRRIILTRPAVEAGEKLGFLPGDMKDKLDPYLQPLYDALGDMIPPSVLHKYIEEGTVQIAPLAFMRGRTLDNAFVILDEAQNTTVAQMKMFLTRMGRNAKFIVTGDLTQVDLPRPSDSGLSSTLARLGGVKGIATVEFDNSDIVRHPLVRHIVEAFKDKKVETE